MPATTAKTIYPTNGHLARQAMELYSAATDRYVPFTGGTFAVGFFLDAAGTQPIAGLTNIAMAAVAGAPGSYFAVIQVQTLAPLVPLAGQTVYQIVRGGPYDSLSAVTPMVVSLARYAQ
jgi:hypothetical protein